MTPPPTWSEEADPVLTAGGRQPTDQERALLAAAMRGTLGREPTEAEILTQHRAWVALLRPQVRRVARSARR